MKLSANQEDALIEIGNIGVSKAAKQLSILLNSPIKISIPKISFANSEKITTFQEFDSEEIFSFVYQQLCNEIEGVSALAFKREQTNLLTMAILGKMPQLTAAESRACEQEALLEIGNIIISSCVSVIGDFLSKKVSLSVPIYDENTVLILIKKLCSSFSYTVKEVLVISTVLETVNDKLSANLFLILTKESTRNVLEKIKGLL